MTFIQQLDLILEANIGYKHAKEDKQVQLRTMHQSRKA
jgi:hypothetical protein